MTPIAVHVDLDGSCVMLCPECGRIASVAGWCKRAICVHAWAGCAPEVWDGDDTDGEGRRVEESLNPTFRLPSSDTWTAMVALESWANTKRTVDDTG